ncbi:MAG: beta strand repeat-containing protein, partial [Limnohabitans sp.]
GKDHPAGNHRLSHPADQKNRRIGGGQRAQSGQQEQGQRPEQDPAPTIAVRRDKSCRSARQTATLTYTLSAVSPSFVQSDVDVSGGTLSNWSQVSPSVYTATFTPTANTAGTATIGVKSGMFSDAAGNNNQDTYVNPAPAGATLETNNQVSLTYNAIAADTTAPTIIVARTNAGTTLANGANETITFTLSEASMDFDLSDIAVTGGTLGNFTPVPTSGTPGTGYTQYTASFTPTANSSGAATIGVAAGKFSDNAGHKNLDTYSASADSVSGHVVESDNQVTLAYNTVPADTTAPKIALTRKGSGSLTAGGSDEITFVLSEASTTFSLADVDVVGGTLTNFAPVLSSGSASTGYTDYTATFTPTANSSGLARIGVQSGKFTDASNNANLDTYVTGVAGTAVEANNLIDITYNTTSPDTTAPTIIVSRAAAGMVSTSETLYFTLSEASSTFTLSDIDVQGGSLSGFAPVLASGDATSGYTQYTAVFTPTANSTGTATVGVKSATFTDMAGNNNADTYVSPAPAGATFETNNQVSLNFNTLVPDTTPPTIAIDRSGSGVVTSTETLTFTLSEPSTNFIATDIDVSGGSLSNFQPVLSSGSASAGYTQYTATFTPTAGVVGSAPVAVASGKFTDAASNANLDTYLANVAGTTQEANNIVSFSVNTDTTAPTVAIARASGATTQTFTGAETINITLSEASTDFSQSDLTVSGGTLSGFAPVASSGSAATGYTQYTVTFTPTANASGSATISVASSTFSDAGGNTNRDTGTNPAPAGATYEANNLISAPFNTDSTTPTVIVTRTSGASGTVTGAESITFTFSEAINPASFDASDIDAVGGAIGNLQPDPSSGTAATGYT